MPLRNVSSQTFPPHTGVETTSDLRLTTAGCMYPGGYREDWKRAVGDLKNYSRSNVTAFRVITSASGGSG